MNKLLAGFASYTEPDLSKEQCTIGMPLGSRLHRIERLPHGWRLWLATNDYVHGTYLEAYDSGMVVSVTVREDEGDEAHVVRPNDFTIRYARRTDG